MNTLKMPGEWQDNLILNARLEDIRKVEPEYHNPPVSGDPSVYYNPPNSGSHVYMSVSAQQQDIAVSGVIQYREPSLLLLEVGIDIASRTIVSIRLRHINSTWETIYNDPNLLRGPHTIDYYNGDQIESITANRQAPEIRLFEDREIRPDGLARTTYSVILKNGQEFQTWQ